MISGPPKINQNRRHRKSAQIDSTTILEVCDFAPCGIPPSIYLPNWHAELRQPALFSRSFPGAMENARRKSPGVFWPRVDSRMLRASSAPRQRTMAGSRLLKTSPFQDACGRTRVRHWPKPRCGNEVIATDFNPTPDNATAPYPYSHFGLCLCSVLYHPPPPDMDIRERMPGRERGVYRQQH